MWAWPRVQGYWLEVEGMVVCRYSRHVQRAQGRPLASRGGMSRLGSTSWPTRGLGSGATSLQRR